MAHTIPPDSFQFGFKYWGKQWKCSVVRCSVLDFENYLIGCSFGGYLVGSGPNMVLSRDFKWETQVDMYSTVSQKVTRGKKKPLYAGYTHSIRRPTRITSNSDLITECLCFHCFANIWESFTTEMMIPFIALAFVLLNALRAKQSPKGKVSTVLTVSTGCRLRNIQAHRNSCPLEGQYTADCMRKLQTSRHPSS